MQKTKWFDGIREKPVRPGVYLTRSRFYSCRKLAWWRAYDGENWRVGVMAVSMEGEAVSSAPDYHKAVNDRPLASHIHIEWCGVEGREWPFM